MGFSNLKITNNTTYINSDKDVSNQENTDFISQSFDNMKTNMENMKHLQDQYLATFDTIKISVEEFVFYKSNIIMIAKLNHMDIPDNQTLLNHMLMNRLAAYEAVKQGIHVSNEEIQQEIDFQREVYENYGNALSEQEKEVMEIMKNRIRITGLSEDEFWESDFVKENYKEALLDGKLMNSFGGDDPTTESYQEYKEKLVDRYQDKLKLNLELLNSM